MAASSDIPRASSRGRGPLLAGCRAIITGASSGLGAECARQLAPVAAALVLAARNAAALEELATNLRGRHPGLRVIVRACDLATDEGRAALWEAVDQGGVDATLLVNNAGLGDYGAFADAEETRLRAQIDLNITAPTLLAHEFARRARRHPGAARAVLNTSSLAASLPLPDLAVYAASKAYVSSLSEALAIELRDQNIRVTALCPGPTPTRFSQTARRAGGPDTDRSGSGWIRMAPDQVVAEALAALEHGKARHFPGWRVRLAAFVFESTPRMLLRAILGLRRRRSLVK